MDVLKAVLSKAQWLLFSPTLLLGYMLYRTQPMFHSDDLEYWLLASQWRQHFQTQSFFTAISAIFFWGPTRPTFHPLLGVPILWLTQGSADLSMVLIGLFLSIVISCILYLLFRRLGMAKNFSIIAAIAVATTPHFLTQGRFFMAEYPFAALCLAGLAFLLSEKYLAFSLCYGCALWLERPLEGFLLFPAFLLFYFSRVESKTPGDTKKFTAAVAAAFFMAAVGYSGKTSSFFPWIERTSFSKDSTHFWRNLRFDGHLLIQAGDTFFKIFGVSGLLIILVSFFIALSGRKERPKQAIAHLVIFCMVLAVFVLIGCFDNGATVDASWRYSLVFVLFFLISAIGQLAYATRKNMAVALLGGFIFMNLYVVARAFPKAISRNDFLLARSVQYHQDIIQSSYFPIGIKPIVDNLGKVVGQHEGNILFVSRSDALSKLITEIHFRCIERLDRYCNASVPGPPYMNEIFERTLKDGLPALNKFGVGAIVFVRETGPGDLLRGTVPNSHLVEIFEAKQEKSLGLTKIGEIQTGIAKGPRVFEVFAKLAP